MNIKKLFVIILTLSFLSFNAQAQTNKQDYTQDNTQDNTRRTLFHSKDNKKQMRERIANLERVIDSLKNELGAYASAEEDTLAEALADSLEFTSEFSSPDWANDSLTIDQRIKLYYDEMRESNTNFPYDMNSLETEQLTSTIPDSVFMQRLTKMNSFIKLPYNQIVKNYILMYINKKSELTSLMLGRAEYYFPIFEEIFSSMNMPLELKALAMIESALNPIAVSKAKAKGMWQFMYRTAKLYNLEITSYVDERLDPIASCYAAAKYLKNAYMLFGDWSLAISSYNCGEGNVRNAIRRAGGSTAFWDIFPYLPKETRGYMPAFVAALYLLKYYPDHQIRPAKCEMPSAVDTFKIDKMLHFEQISNVINMPVDEIKDLNPQFICDIVPGMPEHPYTLNIPQEFSGDFAEKLDSIYKYKDSLYFSPLVLNSVSQDRAISSTNSIRYKIKNGDNLEKIARKYGVKVSDIKYWNGMKHSTIFVGRYLLIYPHGNKYSKPSTTTKTQSSSTSASGATTAPTTGSKIYHTIKRGEVLGTIAQKYHVSVANIKSWNNLKGSNIVAGQKLVIYTNGSAPSSQNSGATTNSTTSTTDNGTAQYYTVKSGDSLWLISQKTGVSLSKLQQLNNIGKKKIYPGMKVRIK